MSVKNKRSFLVSAFRVAFIISLLIPAIFLAWKAGTCEPLCTIAIDSGHSLKKSGASSARNVDEYKFNKRIANQLLDTLRRDPLCRPVFINPEGEDINLPRRVELVNLAKPNLLISIHHDSVQPTYLCPWSWNGKTASYCDKYSGFSVFYSEKNRKSAESLRFALLLGAALLKNGLHPSMHHAEKIKGECREIVDREKGVYRFDDLVLLRSVDSPAVLLECGIIRNRQEELLLNDPTYQSRIIAAISEALSEFRTGIASGH